MANNTFLRLSITASYVNLNRETKATRFCDCHPPAPCVPCGLRGLVAVPGPGRSLYAGINYKF
jgi:hypothetical protein